jgi:hypothetical protein
MSVDNSDSNNNNKDGIHALVPRVRTTHDIQLEVDRVFDDLRARRITSREGVALAYVQRTALAARHLALQERQEERRERSPLEAAPDYPRITGSPDDPHVS